MDGDRQRGWYGAESVSFNLVALFCSNVLVIGWGNSFFWTKIWCHSMYGVETLQGDTGGHLHMCSNYFFYTYVGNSHNSIESQFLAKLWIFCGNIIQDTVA